MARGWSPIRRKPCRNGLPSGAGSAADVTAWRENSATNARRTKARIDSLRDRLAEGYPPARNTNTLAEGLRAARRAIADSTSSRAERRASKRCSAIARNSLTKGYVSESKGPRAAAAGMGKQWTVAVAALIDPEGIAFQSRRHRIISADIDQMQQHLRDMRIKEARVREIRADGRRTFDRRISELTIAARSGGAGRPRPNRWRLICTWLGDRPRRCTGEAHPAPGAFQTTPEMEKKLLRLQEEPGGSSGGPSSLGGGGPSYGRCLPCAVQQAARERAEVAKLVREYEEALAHQAQGEPMGQFEANALARRGRLDNNSRNWTGKSIN